MNIKDLYIRGNDQDPLFDFGSIEENNPILIYIQQILLLLENETRILGASDFNIMLEYYIYETKINETKIKQIITNHINQYCPLNSVYSTAVDVGFTKGSNRDICYVDIVVEREYKISYLIK